LIKLRAPRSCQGAQKQPSIQLRFGTTLGSFQLLNCPRADSSRPCIQAAAPCRASPAPRSVQAWQLQLDVAFRICASRCPRSRPRSPMAQSIIAQFARLDPSHWISAKAGVLCSAEEVKESPLGSRTRGCRDPRVARPGPGPRGEGDGSQDGPVGNGQFGRVGMRLLANPIVYPSIASGQEGWRCTRMQEALRWRGIDAATSRSRPIRSLTLLRCITVLPSIRRFDDSGPRSWRPEQARRIKVAGRSGNLAAGEMPRHFISWQSSARQHRAPVVAGHWQPTTAGRLLVSCHIWSPKRLS
jgi:hypothetical protein